MNNLPKFISIKRTNGEVLYINVNQIVYVTDTHPTFGYQLTHTYLHFEEPDYPTAKAAWVEVWKVTP